MTATIHCPFCGKHHKYNLHVLDSPLFWEGVKYTHFGHCTNTGRLIYANDKGEYRSGE